MKSKYNLNLFNSSNHIRTFSGMWVDVFNPDPHEILIEDIVHALTNQCRFSGHTQQFYSVAQHSIECSKKAKSFKFEALMHDATEAYLVDIPRPIKKAIPEYLEIEKNLNIILAKKFNFIYPFPQEIIDVDNFMLNFEWEEIVLRNNFVIPSITETEKSFINYFNKLKPCTH